jgi:hypothetical protein
MSHSAKGRDILNLCCVGHIEVKYLRALNARCLLLEENRVSQKPAQSLLHRSLVAPALKFTLLGYLALASLFALSQSPKRVPSRRELEFHAPHSILLSYQLAIYCTLTAIWHRDELLFKLYISLPSRAKETTRTPTNFAHSKFCSSPHTSESTASFKLRTPEHLSGQ